MDIDEVEGVAIAHIVLVGLLIVPSFVLWVIGFCTAKQGKDPVRQGFAHLQLAWGLFTFYILFDTMSWILWMVSRHTGRTSVLVGLSTASNHLGNLARWADNITSIVIFLCLFELGCGVLHAFAGQPWSLYRAARIAVLVSVGILMIMALAGFAVWASFYAEFSRADALLRGTSRNLLVRALGGRRLGAAFTVLVFVTSLANLGHTIFVQVKAGKDPRFRYAAAICLSATCIWVLRNIWRLVYVASWTNLEALTISTDELPPYYIDAVDAVMSTMLTFVVLVMLYALGARKTNGLWSGEAAAANYPPTNYPPANVSYPPPPQGYVYAQPPPGQHQWQPQPQHPQMAYYAPQQAYQQPIPQAYQQPMPQGYQQQPMPQGPPQQQQQQQPQQQQVYYPPASTVSSNSPPPQQHGQPQTQVYQQGRDVSELVGNANTGDRQVHELTPATTGSQQQR